jgi:hypothetical protein
LCGLENPLLICERFAVDEKRRRSLQAQADDIEDRQNQRGPGQPTGVRKTFKPRPLGNSRAAILRRLGREFPELHQLVLNGEISPFAAAVAAGFRKRPGPKPKQRPVDPSDITHEQEMELWLGAPDGGSSFASEEERSAAWFRHRDRLMQLWARDGKRPVAWWQHESPAELYYPGPDFERSTLYEWGLLAEGERAELLAFWRREFDRANAAGFSTTMGPGKFLEGEEAKRAHFRWADIPPALVEAWSVELQQRAKKEPAAETAIAGSNQ